MWRNVRRWQGVGLISVALVATVWLAITGQLVLYIHPRYVVFTVVMAAVGLVLVVASFARRDPNHHDHDDPDEGGFPERRRRVGRVTSAVATVVTVAAALSLIVLPPATLSAATATQRDINSATLTADAQTVDSAASATDEAFAGFTVLDWSSLLRQTTDAAFYDGKPVDVVGFITEDPEDPDNMFYVSRFVITCCAVDAQPLGVPVYLENWKSTLAVDQWVEAEGSFTTNPSRDSTLAIALAPDAVTAVEQPADPYLF